MRPKHILLFMQLLMAFAFQTFAQTASQPVQYQLTLDPDGTYKVWMKSITAYSGNSAKIGTSQVSLVVPTATNFTVTNLTGANGMSWNTTVQTRINNPSVGGTPTGKDYINFNYTNSTNLAFDIAANTDILLFSFANSSPCTGPIMLWNTTDPFQVPNVSNFNVGNQITIFGAGFGNRWNSNYGTSPVPCNAPPVAPNLTVTVTPPTTITQNSPANFAVNVNNSGGPSVGTTIVTTPVPAGMTFNGSTGAGWTCSQVSSNVVCNNPNVIPAAGNSPFSLSLTPAQSGAASIASTVSGGGDATPSTSTPANFTASPATATTCLIQYRITTEADGSYKVLMKSSNTFTGTAATIGTAQVTVLAPNSTPLVVTNLMGFNGMTWTTSVQTRLNNPSQNANSDYIVFNFSQSANPALFDIIANQEYALFSFKNGAACVGALSLWASTDPIQVPNVQNFNVGNQISVNGAGQGNKWCTNYGTTAPCPTVSTATITSTTTIPSSTTVGVPFTVGVNISNTGTGATSTPLTVTTPIPAGTTFTGSTGTGWTCSQQGSNVVCTNPNSIPSGGSAAPLGVIFTPTQTGTPTIQTTTTGGGLVNPLVSTPTVITVNPASSASPVLGVTLSAPATGTQNVPFSYSAVVSNTGTVPTVGATSLTFVLPSGTTYVSSTGNGWFCSPQNTTVVCTNSSPIANGSSSSVGILVNPTQSGTINAFAYTNGGGASSAYSNVTSTTVSGTGAANVVVTSVPNPATATTNVPFTTAVVVSNMGNAPASGPFTYTATLPAGVNFLAVNSGWNCTQTGQQLNCSNPISIANASSVPLNIQYIATQPVVFVPTGTLAGNGISGGSVVISGTPININNGASQPCTSAVDCGIGVRYGIKLGTDGKTYTVFMKSATAFTGGAARIGTAQVTLKVPHGLGINRFIATNLTGFANTGTMNWTTGSASRVDSPTIDPNSDYIFFGFSQATSPALFDIAANVEYPLFSFQNQNNCNGAVGIWETTDPFQAGFQSLNPGNQMTILGNGTPNAWKCNYTCALPCVSPNVSIAIAPFTLFAGQASNVVVSVTNNGILNINGQLTTTITLPNGATAPAFFASNGWSCGTSGQQITCTNPNAMGFAVNTSLSMTIPVSTPANATSGQIVTIVAQISQIAGETILNDNSTSGTGTLISGSNLRVVKSASPLALQGTPFDYVFTVSNIGGTNSLGTITITDTLRNGLKYISAMGTGWTCNKIGVDSQNNDIVQCTTSTVHLANIGNFSTFTLKVNPTLAVTAGNIAYASGGGMNGIRPSAPCANCNAGMTNVFVQPSPDATVTILQPSPNLIVGQPSTITVNINNTGGSVITTPVTTTITLPAGMTMPPSFTSGTWNCTTLGQIVTCTNPNTSGIPAGGSLALNIIVTPPPTLAGTTPTFTINVLPFVGEISTTNNGGTLVILNPIGVAAVPDLAIALSQPLSSLLVGQNSTMNVLVSNIGTGAATGQLTVSMAVPNGITMASGTSNGWNLSVNGGILTATHPNPSGLLGGTSTSFVLNFTPNASIINSQPTFVAIVNTVPNETNSFNNTAILNTIGSVSTVGTPNLTVNATLSNNFVANQASIFNVFITNNGSVPATGALTTTLTLPNGFSAPSSFISNGWSGTTVGQTVTLTNANVGGLLSGSVLNVQIPVTPAASAVGSAVSAIFVFNVSQVAGEVATVDNVFYFISTAPVLSNPSPNVTVSINAIIPSLTVNQPSNLIINYVNNGTLPQTGVLTTTIVLPSGISVPTSFMTNGWSCNLTGQTLTCTNPNTGGLSPNGTMNIVLPVTPNNGTAGQTPGPINIYINGSTVPYTYVFTSPIASGPAPNLTINIANNVAPMTAGQVNYIPVVISNTGSVNATGQLTINVTLPNGMSAPASFMQGNWTCNTFGQNINCINPNTGGLSAGGMNVLLFPVIPSNILVGTTPAITININSVFGELITNNNTIIYVINPAIVGSLSPDLTVEVSQPSPTLAAGQASTIMITVQNMGNAAANGSLLASFTLPNNFSMAASSFMSGAWTCSVVGQNVSCTNPNIGGLAAGGTSTFSVQILPSGTAVGSVMSFIVSVNTIVGELNTVNNFTTLISNVPVVANPNTMPNPNLVLTYNQSASYFQNTPFNLNYLVYNSSQLAATTGTITVRDTLRNGLRFVSGTGIGWTINKSGTDTQGNDIILSTYNGGALAANASTAYNLTLNPTLTGTMFHQAYMMGGGMSVSMKGSAPCIGCVVSPTGPIVIGVAINYDLAVKAILQGPYVVSTGLMYDSLRVKNLLPLSNPYTTLAGFTQVGSGFEITSASVLAITGSNAIVDWVLVELRSAANPSQIVATRAGLIQRDGDVVSPSNGTSALQFTGIPAGNYYVAVRHRNHLGAMSASPVALGATIATLDMTNAAQPAYKTAGATTTNYPQYVMGNKAMLWAGNAAYNNQVIFQGPGNDVDTIFFTIISDPLNTQVISNFINRGYFQSDVNMDGKTVFQGPDNEVDIIFFNVLTHLENPNFLANFIIWQQLP